MKALKLIITLALIGLVSACAVPRENVGDQQPVAVERVLSKEVPVPVANAPKLSVDINKVLVDVPLSLKVSERNSYYPGVDIVWRGDPFGDRHAQVKAIFETAFNRAADEFVGEIPADLHVRVHRFHGLTERARYTTGGIHAITFSMQLYDARDGRALTEPRRVRADLEAFGGIVAVRAESRGLTQKKRITDHLAQVLRNELTHPEGHKNARLGLIQALNTF